MLITSMNSMPFPLVCQLPWLRHNLVCTVRRVESTQSSTNNHISQPMARSKLSRQLDSTFSVFVPEIVASGCLMVYRAAVRSKAPESSPLFEHLKTAITG